MSVNDTNVVDDIGTVPDRNLVVLSAAIAGFTSSAASQFVGTGRSRSAVLLKRRPLLRSRPV